MKNIYLKFVLQRVPIIPQLLLSYGLAYSGMYLTDVRSSVVHFISLVIFVFLTQLRFMDEIKDFEKDKIANPDRPLPQGLISTKQVTRCITVIGAILIFLNIYTFGLSYSGGLWLIITLVWLQLMYKEFFIEETLGEYPLIYAITHQIIIVPLVLFIVTSIDPEASVLKALQYALTVFGGFFSYEVGRKLNPKAHEILKTYLKVYGLSVTIILSSLLMGISCFFASQLGLFKPIAISSFVALLSYSLIYFKPKLYKLTELMITLNLLLILWIIPIQHWINS